MFPNFPGKSSIFHALRFWKIQISPPNSTKTSLEFGNTSILRVLCWSGASSRIVCWTLCTNHAHRFGRLVTLPTIRIIPWLDNHVWSSRGKSAYIHTQLGGNEMGWEFADCVKLFQISFTRKAICTPQGNQ